MPGLREGHSEMGLPPPKTFLPQSCGGGMEIHCPHRLRGPGPHCDRQSRPNCHPGMRKHQEREVTYTQNSLSNSQTLQTSPSGCLVLQTPAFKKIKKAKMRSFPHLPGERISAFMQSSPESQQLWKTLLPSLS